MSRFLTLLLALLLAAQPALAVKRPEVPDTTAGDEVQRGDPLIQRIQRGLAEAGLYLGPANGVMDAETEKAIRDFQKRSGQTPDAKATEQLALQIESGHKIQALLGRLEQVRTAHIEAARGALMSREETRKLLETPPDETADPTRDPRPCFRTPTPECLLAEAAETAKTIPTADLRDWARGEILVAQAKAGLIPEAMDTARRIQDPRLILVALRDIAEGQALAGRAAQAVEAAEAVPDKPKRAEALLAIAELEARRSLMDGAAMAAKRLLALLPEIAERAKRVDWGARAAVVLRRAGDAAGGAAALTAAEAEARKEADAKARGGLLRSVALALGETGQPAEAAKRLEEIQEKADQVPVLMALVGHHLRQKDLAGAEALAERIAEPRYQAVALAQVAGGHGDAGRPAEAERLLAVADGIAKEVALPFARDYAVAQMATARSRLGLKSKDPADFDAAGKTIMRIADDRLRAQMLWTLAADRRRAGDAEGARRVEGEARDATIDVKSSLTRVWLHGDVALERAGDGETEAARAAFRRGLEEAEPLDNAWGRARALAKLASTLNDLRRSGVTP